MALTQEDLQAIAALMDSRLEPVNDRLNKLEQTVQDDLGSLKKDVAILKHGLEPKLDKVLEMVSSANDRNRQLDLIADKVDDHEHRLFAIEKTLKQA